MKQLVTLVISICISLFSNATTYYSDPVNGSMSNPGTSAQPWANLEAIFNSGQTFNAGDVILLRDGNHGFPKINGTNSAYVSIQAQTGHNPVLNRVYIGNIGATSYWKLSGLTIQTINVSTYPISLITLYPSTSNIVIENCTIQSTNNTSAYSRNDWRTKSNNGIRAQGMNHIIQNNTISNVAVGLSIEALGTLVNHNLVQYFTIDGIRGLASDCIYQNNTVLDNIVVFTYAENHYDGFQAYTCCPVGADTLKNVIIRQNLIINTTDTTRQWRGPMQGISCFDGFFENWTVENNVVITDHWHGITLLGAINCRIINNTCVDPYDISPIDPYDTASTAVHGPSWVSIKAHKNGSPSYGNTIQNNMASTLNNDVGIGTVSHNVLIGGSVNYPNHFVDYLGLDYHLISGSTAIDAGISTFAPNVDKDNVSRPQGVGIDAGAYEYFSTVVDTQYVSICDGDFLTVGNSTYTSAGTYIDTLQSSSGTDSVEVTYLTVTSISTSTTNDTICNGETYQFGANTYTQSGVYNDTLISVLTNCDSVSILNLSVLTSSNSMATVNICPGENYVYGDSTYVQSTTIYDTIVSNNTCTFKAIDVVFVQSNIDLSVSVNGDTLTSNDNNSTTYQWIDCINNIILVGETNQTFVAQQNGEYAVILTGDYDCADTSNCVTLTNVGLNDDIINVGFVNLYPNPNNGSFKINMPNVNSSYAVFIYNPLGQVVYTGTINSNQQNIQTHLSKGFYEVKIVMGNQVAVKKMIVE